MAMSAILRHEAADDRLLVAGTIACLAISAALLHFFAPINHDEAYFMALAGRLLDGGQFGKDIMDVNPPHVWWISAMPVWLARQTGFRLDVAAAVFTVTMAVLSVAAVARLTAAAGLGRAPRSLFLVFATLLVLFIPGYDFGQREHWMVLLTLPYIVARGCRLNNSAVSPATGAAIGVAAALGFCIKPYFLLVPVALEVWILAPTRRPSLSIRPETIAMAVSAVRTKEPGVIVIATGNDMLGLITKRSITWHGSAHIRISQASSRTTARSAQSARFVSLSGSDWRGDHHQPGPFCDLCIPSDDNFGHDAVYRCHNRVLHLHRLDDGNALTACNSGALLHKQGQHLAMHWRTHQPAFVMVAGFGKTRVTQAHFGLPTMTQHENGI
jgi:hypothetical protein